MGPLSITYKQLPGSEISSRRKRATKWLRERSRNQVVLTCVVLLLVGGVGALLGLLLSHTTNKNTSAAPAPAPGPSPVPPPIVSDAMLSKLIGRRDPVTGADINYDNVMLLQAASSLHAFMALQVKQYNRQRVDEAAGIDTPWLISQLAVSSRLMYERANITIYSPASWYWVRAWQTYL